MDPIEQWRSLLSARLLIGAHCSGLTNLVFTPDGCHVLEIDLRRHFTCDPLCEAHRQGTLAPGEPCSNRAPAYRKADYHNLAGLFGRSYQSLSAEVVQGYRSANPIDVSTLRVRGEAVLAQIRARLRATPPVSDPAPLRLAVLSSFDGRPPWSRDSLANHLAYCLRHGYDYWPALQRKQPELHHSWERVARLRQLLRSGNYDAVFWMDSDSWFLDAAFPIERLLRDSVASIQFAGDQRDPINTGPVLFRCDASVLAFLDHWWALRLIHPDRDASFLGAQAMAKSAITVSSGLPSKAYPWAVQPGDFILCFVGDQAKQWMERSRCLVERYPA